MSRRRAKSWSEAHEISHFILTHPADDHVVIDKNGRTFIVDNVGTGKSHILPTILFENKSDRTVFISSAHHGSAAENVVLNPPKLAEFFMLLLPMKYRENLIGDAEEEYVVYIFAVEFRSRGTLPGRANSNRGKNRLSSCRRRSIPGDSTFCSRQLGQIRPGTARSQTTELCGCHF